MKTFTKTLVGTVAAGAMAVSAAAPASAQNRDYRHDRDGVSAGEVIAGALIIGGIAAAVSAGSNGRYDRDYRYDRSGYPNGSYGNDGRYGNYYGGNPRQAVEQCVYAAERQAGRRADVTDIRDVRQTRYGYEVRGRIAVNGSNRGWRNGDSNYGQGWNNDYRGWNSNLRGYDSGSFKCRYERGRVYDIDYSGIRGL